MIDRVVGVSVPLTEEQQELLAASGHHISDVVIVGRSGSVDRLENELSSGFDNSLSRAIYDQNERYQSAIEADELASLSRYARGEGREPARLAYVRSAAGARRPAGIRVPLSAEQRRAINDATGADVREVVFIGMTSSAQPLRHEITTGLDRAAVLLMAQAGARFAAAVESDAEAARSEWYSQGSPFREPPTLGFVR